MSSEAKNDKVSVDNINRQVLAAKYEVRGKVPVLATEISSEIAAAKESHQVNPYPFDDVIFLNIGNPQQLKQKPMTMVRQLTALIEYPQLSELAPSAFPADVQERAKVILSNGGSGPYTHSQGFPCVRKDVSDFLEERDGHGAHLENIFLTDGASTGVKNILNILIANEHSGIMIPIPQYPLYSASLALFGGVPVPYYLNEESSWSTSVADLEKARAEAIAKGIKVRAIVFINPSNPCGVLLPIKDMLGIIDFCERYNIVLMADEVYQENLYQEGATFTSFRKLVLDNKKDVQIVTYHSISKGFFGECGKRGGFFVVDNFDPKVVTELYKMASVSLCPNTVGQVVCSVMVRPPKKGEPSYELFMKEKNDILASLKRRAVKLAGALNELEGFSCCPPTSSMYLFPQVRLPTKSLQAAKAAGEKPDTFYCLELLKATGLCVVPGSGFGQKEGTFHFRTTFLPPEEAISSVVSRLKGFHEAFMARYSDQKL